MKRQKVEQRLEIESKVTLEDGRIQYNFKNGAVSIIPPLPGKEWQDRVSRDMSRISYGIMRRVEAEKRQKELEEKT